MTNPGYEKSTIRNFRDAKIPHCDNAQHDKIPDATYRRCVSFTTRNVTDAKTPRKKTFLKRCRTRGRLLLWGCKPTPSSSTSFLLVRTSLAIKMAAIRSNPFCKLLVFLLPSFQREISLLEVHWGPGRILSRSCQNRGWTVVPASLSEHNHAPKRKICTRTRATVGWFAERWSEGFADNWSKFRDRRNHVSLLISILTYNNTLIRTPIRKRPIKKTQNGRERGGGGGGGGGRVGFEGFCIWIRNDKNPY